MVIEAFKYLTKIQSKFEKAGIDLQQNRKRSAEIAEIQSIQEDPPKQQKLRQNIDNSVGPIDYTNQDHSGNNLVAIKYESIYDSSYATTEEKNTNEELEILRDDENIEIIDINQEKTTEQQITGVNQFIENAEPTDKKIKIPAPPDREILNSLALQRAGTLEDPYLVYVAPGVRKSSVNYYFLIGGELFYATKRHSMRFTDKFGPERHKITVQCSKSA